MKFKERISSLRGRPLTAEGISVLQINMGYRCNMHCGHCHVSAGPRDDREMGAETVEGVVSALRRTGIRTLDITGGAPELNLHFRRLVEEARALGVHVIARTNLTVFFEEGMADLPDFYASNSVEVIASLPCYSEAGVDGMRGGGAFKKSISAITKLNRLGYGCGSDERRLCFVYNPSGPFLPPLQSKLEDDYRRVLRRDFGISFDRLYVFTNMPIGRFRDLLVENGSLEKYQALLESSFNGLTLGGVMCRNLISVGWDGRLYDCDFNQILGLRLDERCPGHISGLEPGGLVGREISVGEHCYGCTAGQGST